MTRAGLYVHALRAARGRQLRARALRPFRRGRFPGARGAQSVRPLAAGLWASTAFADADRVAGEGAVVLHGKELAFPPVDWALPGEPRLRRFQLHYGEETLGWARRGELAAARDGMSAWIGANPPRRGDAWHPYVVSTRIGNWVAAISLAPELATPTVSSSLDRQLSYLVRNVEDEILGNHVIRNARALVLGGVALERQDAVEQGLALLRRELPEQVLADGGHYERSPAYHLLVLRDLLEVREQSDAAWLDEPIERMRRFSAALTRPDGAPALFNDGALELAPSLALPAPQDGLTTFAETGYAVLRDRGVWLAFDCGPAAPPYLPAHAHADALSFQLWVDGSPLVIDPGSFTYEPGPDRDAFRGTRSHSTVALDGESQFQLWGAFRAGPLPVARLLGTDPLEAEVSYAGITHRRRLTLGEDRLLVEDELTGEGSRHVESSLPLAAPLSAEQTGPLETTVEDGWRSERMFERAVTPVVRASGQLRLPARLGWSIPLPSRS